MRNRRSMARRLDPSLFPNSLGQQLGHERCSPGLFPFFDIGEMAVNCVPFSMAGMFNADGECSHEYQ